MKVDPRMTLARARETLGGRVVSHASHRFSGGEIVRANGDVGVVLWSDGARCDVWIGEAVKRVAAGEVERASSPELATVAEDARVFAALEEGARVAFDGTVTGNLDSMLNKLTAQKKVRGEDQYSPGGRTNARPNRASIVYCNLARQAFPGVPVVLGGIEASLRRIAHYDYWSDSVRRSIVLDSKC